MRGLALILLLAGCFSLFSGQAALAQFDDQRQVRTTTHLVHTAGWEKDLIQRTPNLKHWSWHPIISYPQERGLVGPGYNGHLTSQTPRRSVYVKPEHVPTMVRTNVCAAPLPEWQTQIAYNAPQANASGNNAPGNNARDEVYGILRSADNDLSGKLSAPRKQDVSASLSHRDVAGSLSKRDVAAALSSRDTGARLTLGQRGLGGRLASRNVNGVLAYPEVYGTLASPTVDGNLMSAGLRGALLGRNGTKEVTGRFKG